MKTIERTKYIVFFVWGFLLRSTAYIVNSIPEGQEIRSTVEIFSILTIVFSVIGLFVFLIFYLVELFHN